MSTPLIVNGVLFNYPQTGDESWGTAATGWAQAVTSGMLQKSGGFFLLTALVDFGPNFGIKVKSIATETANPSTAGYMALAKTDSIGWRNNANSGNLLLSVDGSDNLTFNGSPLSLTALADGHIFVGNVSNVPTPVVMSGDATLANTGALTIANSAVTLSKIAANAVGNSQLAANAVDNSKVASGAAIAVSKLAAQTASRAAAFDGSGLLVPSATTAAELGYVNGVTSAIQTQLNALTNGVKYFQTIQATSSAVTSTTSSTFTAATGHSVTITPSSSSHLIELSFTFFGGNSSTATNLSATLYRNGTIELSGVVSGFVVSNNSGGSNALTQTITYIDSPGTTSATTYQLYFRSTNNTNTVTIGSSSLLDVMIAREIA